MADQSDAAALAAYFDTPTLAEARHILEQHPEILDLDVAQLGQPTSAATTDARLRRSLLDRAQRVGIAAAFAELAPDVPAAPVVPRVTQPLTEAVVRELVDARGFSMARSIVEAHPELLSDAALTMLDGLATAARNDEARLQDIAGTRAILQLSRQVGVASAFSTLAPRDYERTFGAEQDPPQVAAALREFFDAPTMGAARRVLEAHPELLTSNLVDLTLTMAENQVVEADRYKIDEVRRLLRRARELGIAAAFGDLPEDADAQAHDERISQLIEQALGSSAVDDVQLAIDELETRLGRDDLPKTGRGSRQELLMSSAALSQHLYALAGVPRDLDRILARLDEAMRSSPPGDPILPIVLAGLGEVYAMRYGLLGSVEDLQQALSMSEEAVRQARALQLDWTGPAIGLASVLHMRYLRTLQRADLERALDLTEQAAALQSYESAVRPSLLDTLATLLRERFGLTGQPVDLDRAIELSAEAVHLSALASTARGLAPLRSHLSDGHLERYRLNGDRADLRAAVDNAELAVQHTNADSGWLPRRLSKLASALRVEYAATSEVAELSRAIELDRRAAELTSRSADEAAVLSGLGLDLEARFERDRNPQYLEEAAQAWERVWSVLDRVLRVEPIAYRLGQQTSWAGFYSHLVATHLRRAAVNPAARVEATRRALEVVEGSKSRLLAQAVGRSGTPPRGIPVELAVRERNLLTTLGQLDTAELTARRGVASEDLTADMARLGERQRCIAALEEVWKEIVQRVPQGAEYVALRRGDPLRWAELSALAESLGESSGVLSCFISPGNAQLFAFKAGWSAPRPIETGVDLWAWSDAQRRLYRELHGPPGPAPRRETWSRQLLGPLRDALAALAPIDRLVVSPQGPAHLLPWMALAAAAGSQVNGAPLPVNVVPALGLLPRLRRRPAGAGRSVLVVGNPRGDLPYAEREARALGELLGTRPLIGAEATRENVLGHLAGARIVHLATHAAFSPGAPLDSGIVLADGVLTAREVMWRNVQAELLVLSACQTGLAESLGGEELAGLAEAFLHAGARSLLVSLWSVNDASTEALMRWFYGYLALGSDKARALSAAIGAVRSQPAFAHPHFWAPFQLMGDW